MNIKPLANTVALSSADNCYLATAVYVVTSNSDVTVTLANTDVDTGSRQHGSYAGGSIVLTLPANSGTIIRKRPNDTLEGAGCFGTKVAEGAN
jgi:hypothetical protein